jgi:hypothetical protein
MPRETIKTTKPRRAATTPVVAAKVAVTETRPERTPRAPSLNAPVDANHRRALIAEAAYYRSLREGGSEIEHWLAAEQEVDALLMKPTSR